MPFLKQSRELCCAWSEGSETKQITSSQHVLSLMSGARSHQDYLRTTCLFAKNKVSFSISCLGCNTQYKAEPFLMTLISRRRPCRIGYMIATCTRTLKKQHGGDDDGVEVHLHTRGRHVFFCPMPLASYVSSSLFLGSISLSLESNQAFNLFLQPTPMNYHVWVAFTGPSPVHSCDE